MRTAGSLGQTAAATGFSTRTIAPTDLGPIPQHLHPRVTVPRVVQAGKTKDVRSLAPSVSRSCVSVTPHPSGGAAALLAVIKALSPMAIRERFPREANAHRGMLRRVKAGIRTVHEPWRDLCTFVHDLIAEIGPHPGGTMSLDRRNNADIQYAPGKVRWSDKSEQSLNRRTTRMTAGAGGREVPACIKAAKHGLAPATVRQRLKRGYTDEEAFSLARGARRRRSGDAGAAEAASPAAGSLQAPKGAQAPLLGAAWRVWCEAWEAAFPHAPGPLQWTKPQRGQMAQLLARAERMGNDGALDFLRFAVTRWRGTLAAISWMKKRPAFPSPGFLASGHGAEAIFDAYAGRKEADALARLRGAEGEYARLRAQGVSHDEAIMEIAGRKARAEERAKLEEARKHLALTAKVMAADRLASPRALALCLNRKPLPVARAKHGDNPFARDEVDFEDLSQTIPPWSDEEPQAQPIH